MHFPLQVLVSPGHGPVDGDVQKGIAMVAHCLVVAMDRNVVDARFVTCS